VIPCSGRCVHAASVHARNALRGLQFAQFNDTLRAAGLDPQSTSFEEQLIEFLCGCGGGSRRSLAGAMQSGPHAWLRRRHECPAGKFVRGSFSSQALGRMAKTVDEALTALSTAAVSVSSSLEELLIRLGWARCADAVAMRADVGELRAESCAAGRSARTAAGRWDSRRRCSTTSSLAPRRPFASLKSTACWCAPAAPRDARRAPDRTLRPGGARQLRLRAHLRLAESGRGGAGHHGAHHSGGAAAHGDHAGESRAAPPDDRASE
jgi:hypothetical protein